MSEAAEAIRVHRSMHYNWMQNPWYARAFKAAEEQAADRLESEMVRRAVDGWDEPVFGRLEGKDAGEGQIGVVRKFSDRLLEVGLRARRPEKYRERMDIKSESTIRVLTAADLKGLTTDELKQLAALARKATGGTDIVEGEVLAPAAPASTFGAASTPHLLAGTRDPQGEES